VVHFITNFKSVTQVMNNNTYLGLKQNTIVPYNTYYYNYNPKI